MFTWFLRKVIGKIVARPVRRQLYAFEALTHQPREVQEELLTRILARQRDTAFGRDHHFADIHSAADFRRQLPVAPYDYFEPYLARVRRGEINALSEGEECTRFPFSRT